MRQQLKRKSSGFTLIEVIIAIAILSTMVIAITTLLRSGLDIRVALSSTSKLTHRMNVAIRVIGQDLKHAFVLDSNDSKRVKTGSNHTLFKIEKTGDSDKIYMTTMSHDNRKANVNEGDLAYVVYEVKKDDKGFSHLYRGYIGRTPESFREDPPMYIAARYIKSIKFDAWKGDAWSRQKWDSSLGDTRNKLPHMVRVTIVGWDALPEEDQRPDELDQYGFLTYGTTLYLPYAGGFQEMKQKLGSFKL